MAVFRKVFKPQPGVRAEYSINIEEKKKKMVLTVNGATLDCRYGTPNQPTMELMLPRAAMEDIVNGRMTFQRAFMSGQMKSKGDFSVLRILDQLFPFEMK